MHYLGRITSSKTHAQQLFSVMKTLQKESIFNAVKTLYLDMLAKLIQVSIFTKKSNAQGDESSLIKRQVSYERLQAQSNDCHPSFSRKFAMRKEC